MDPELAARLARIESSLGNLHEDLERQAKRFDASQDLLVQLLEILTPPSEHKGEALEPLLRGLIGGLGDVTSLCRDTLTAMTKITAHIDSMARTPDPPNKR